MSAHASTAAPSILLIDSNVLFVRRVTDALKREGFEVVHTPSSDYALTMLEYAPPAAILCSTALREMGAHDLPRILHADARTANIPVIAVGDGGEHALMSAFRAGCDDFIDRRTAAEAIATQVRAFLRSHDEGFHPTQMLVASETALTGNLSHLDLPGVVQMLGHSRQTGALHINARKIDGVVFFEEGECWHAEAGEMVGDDAVIHIIRNCSGSLEGVYKFIPGVTATTRTVLRCATELMLEALRVLDEDNNETQGEQP